MPRKAEYALSRELGLCVECNQPAAKGKSRCPKHQAARVKNVYACTWCGSKGHNRRTCGELAKDKPWVAEARVQSAEAQAEIPPEKNPFEWELRRRRDDRIRGALETVLGAKTLRDVANAAKAALELL